MAGYSSRSLLKKLGIKADDRVAFVHQPAHYADLLGDLPDAVIILDLRATDLDFVHAFYTEKALLEEEFNTLKAAIRKDGTIWISWYKKAAKIPTDITEDVVREIGLARGLVDVKVAAIDEQWSGLKFVYRKEDR
jgi:hypothetical protein